MATSQEVKAALAQKMAGGSAPARDSAPVSSNSVGEQIQDRFIKGTLIDDRIIGFLQKAATIIFIVALLGALWLWAERSFGVKVLAPYRIWSPSIFMVVMMFIAKPFLRLGWFGWAFVLVQSINLSGYLFQTIQSVTGVR
jgi:hypothetical protein